MIVERAKLPAPPAEPRARACLVEQALDPHQRFGALAGEQNLRRSLASLERRVRHGRGVLRRRQARQRPQLDALMGVGHDVVPDQRRDGAAGHALGRRIIVVAHPDRAGEIARVADEPGVAIAVGGAGLARDLECRRAGPVGRCRFRTTEFIIVIMSRATCGLITCSGRLPSRSKRHTSSPVPVRTSSAACGATALPRLGKVA